jgi:nucleotide-binding universal stress UspA family protein
MALCAESKPPVPLELRLVENATAAKGIVQTAKDDECDLIVAGSHGRSGFDSLVLGSVATKLLHLSPIPILIAR